MCLAVPGRVTKIGEKQMADVDFGSVVRPVSLLLLPDAREGDWVLVHAGFAIQVVIEEDARETRRLLEEMYQYEESE